MTNHKLIFRTILLCALSFACFTLTTHAQSQRTFVSTSGSDANTASLCSAANPCRSFTAALTVTTAGGEIIALTSGGYGAVTIDKSVQITAPTGVHGGITAFSGNAITVNASGATVVLRGLTLNSIGATNGINATAFSVLHVEGCVINGFGSNGILINLTADGSRAYIKDTIMRNGGFQGIQTLTSTGTLAVTIDRCRAENNGVTGFGSFAGTQMTVRDSLSSGNQFGFSVGSTNAEMSIENCVATNNSSRGIFVGSGNTLRLSSTMVTENRTGIFNNGTLESFGNNRVFGNGTNVSGNMITTIGQI